MKTSRAWNSLREVIDGLRLPCWEWIQVEVTSHCNAACIYCPHTVYRDQWACRHMPMETFRRLLPFLPKVGHIHLQGWGEPFLCPHFFEMVHLSKESGCRVGTTTNAMLLDERLAEQLVAVGIDVVAVSLAGIDRNHDAIRQGTRLKTVLTGVERLQKARERAGSATPKIHAAYMLLRSRLTDLTRIPAFLSSAGFDQAVISTLDFIASCELQNEAVVPGSRMEYDELHSRLDAMVDEARSRNLAIQYHLDFPLRRRLFCTENVQRALVVAADGTVAPCVYFRWDIPGMSCWRRGQRHPCSHSSFGNINNESLGVLWHTKEYRQFRKSFAGDDLATPCRQCPKLYGE